MARIADEHAPSFIISTGQHAVAYRPPCLILAKFRQFVGAASQVILCYMQLMLVTACPVPHVASAC